MWRARWQAQGVVHVVARAPGGAVGSRCVYTARASRSLLHESLTALWADLQPQVIIIVSFLKYSSRLP